MAGLTCFSFYFGVQQLIIHSNYWPENEGQIGLSGIIQFTIFLVVSSLVVFFLLSVLVRIIFGKKRLINLLWLNAFISVNLCIIAIFWVLPAII
jgi:hypothetical protein